MTGSVLRLGFVGLGQAMNLILQRPWELEGLPYQIVAGADPRPHAREQFERDFPNGHAFATAEELCESDVDVVYVATGPALHREHALLAAKTGKHIIVEKPLALTIDDCIAMVQAAEAHGVYLLAGHTHSFAAPHLKAAEIVASGELGALTMINSWMYNEFNLRPWPTSELRETQGPLLNQGPHQVDIVRQLGGGMVASLRGRTIWDSRRGCAGGYVAMLMFDGGVPATLVFDARGYFDVAELYDWIGEGGQPRDPERPFEMRRNFRALESLASDEREQRLSEQKEEGRYGGQREPGGDAWRLWGYTFGEENHQPFFGLHVVSCERGAIRQSADGLYVYGDEAVEEIRLDDSYRGRAAELMELYSAVTEGTPLRHSGAWATATLEVCLAIEESSRSGVEVPLRHQVPLDL